MEFCVRCIYSVNILTQFALFFLMPTGNQESKLSYGTEKPIVKINTVRLRSFLPTCVCTLRALRHA